MTARADFSITKFMNGARLDSTAELRSHGLHAVANTEHRYAKLKYRRRRCGRTGNGHRLGTAREDDAFRAEFANSVVTGIPRMDLAIHTELAYAPRDELRVLRTEIENEDSVGVDVGHEMR